ncbi:Hypothetical protein, putative [Bodo saltans]|uniref:Fucolectin tachylectin-4 pentraxin-1 domain-containing protein n=1 Tax=Bodo saltans TaxID=75058 RepID=A0A0S4KKF6_BODSA|nr:Hypothetical protein, putative [Bodo saltans]|eukprot:CUI14115.1 Hypothetical protein, putative [Bodo saltans]
MKKAIIRTVGVEGFHAFICGMLALVSCCDAFPGVRYVRVEDLYSGNDALVINQVAAYTCGDSTNVAYGKTATGSAFDGSGDGSCAGTATTRAPSVAVTVAPDCNAARSNTFCSSDVVSYWWQVDLGAAYDICSVAILQSSTGTGAQIP